MVSSTDLTLHVTHWEARLALDASLSEIVPRLMTRFSSKEGYRAFHDAIPTGTQAIPVV
jgi:hypothetical protein